MTIAFSPHRLRSIAADKCGHKTATEIANHVGIDRGSVLRYLQGNRQPGVERLHRIAKAYEVDQSELLTESAA